MPLSQVTAGMHCTAASVVQGTDIATFDIDILDVVTGTDGTNNARILFRASGPAVAATGIGPGFSGSPISCPDGDGVQRIIGAISEGIGDYGNDVALATPIEAMLQTPVDPPRSARRDAALLRRARPLATPLTFSGLSGPVADLVRRAGAAVGRPLLTVPSRPRASFPVQQLVPGAAMSVGYSSGDIGLGAIGTVTYTDGDAIWAFGHPLDGAGARSLILSDAYVYTVIGNPIGTPDATSYKLAAPGHDVGTFTDDGPDAVTGRIGPAPVRIPLTVTAHNADLGTTVVLHSMVADERALGLPAGGSPLSLVAPISTIEAAYRVLLGNPSAQSGSMCLSMTIEGRSAPAGFCNRYVGALGGQGGLSGSPIMADVSNAVGALDAYRFGPPKITAMSVTMTLRRGLHQAYMLSASGPRAVRRGSTVSVRIHARNVLGPDVGRTIRVKIPKGMPPGRRDLVLDGTPADIGGAASPTDTASVLNITLGDGGNTADSPGARTVAALAGQISGIRREDAVYASFLPPRAAPPDHLPGGAEGVAQRSRVVLHDATLRFSGRVRLRVEVR